MSQTLPSSPSSSPAPTKPVRIPPDRSMLGHGDKKDVFLIVVPTINHRSVVSMCGGCSQAPAYPLHSDNANHPLLEKITDTRLDRFFAGPYASQHLDTLLDRTRISDSPHVQITKWSAPGITKPSFDEAVAQIKDNGEIIEKGYLFGKSWTNHWLHVVIDIPEGLRASQQVIFEFDPSCEALIFSPDGTPLHGITGGPNTLKDGKPGEQEDRTVEHIIPEANVREGHYEVVIEVTCNSMFGLGPYRYQTPDLNRTFPLVSADIVVPNLEARALRYDFRILTEVARHPDGRLQGLSQKALKAADDIMNTFRRRDGDLEDGFIDDIIQQCRKLAWGVLGQLDQEGLKGVCMRSTEQREGKMWAMGHCHIDTAWLWRYTQTQQKIARSWSTQCDLMDRWPNHQFSASSAQQYKWLEELYPKAFDRVKGYIQKGRFHYVGGAWLEHDCMIPSGESLVRQYLYGQRYFRSRFGAYCREAFLPDTFGYASQLPQILRLAGLNYFMTQKLAWNNITSFPYTTFNWAGLDGTQVLAHMPSVDNYNSQCTFDEIVKGVRNNKNLGVTDQCLMLFGNGDGGGGPTPTMLEKLDRLSSLSMTNPEVPTIKVGAPIEFFDDLCRKTDSGKKLPTWHGELYLELHRGSKLKEGNKNMETLLRDLEYFATLASLQDPTYHYPKSDLDEMWQDTMLAQFHDCIPGTTIRTVVEDNLEIYTKRSVQAQKLIQQAIDVLSAGSEVAVVDPLRLKRDHVLEDGGKLSWIQTDHRGIGSITDRDSIQPPRAYQIGGSHIIENSRFRLTISQGRITSLIDLVADRELITVGPGATDAGLVLYEDYPLTYDAWDAEIYHLQSYTTLQLTDVSFKTEPLRASLVGRVSFGKSSAVVTLSLDATAKDAPDNFIHVKVNVDWREKHKFLKFSLPVDIKSSYATYSTQFGTVLRPTHRNTLQDQAKFEACAHGYVDFSEANYGVALVSRDKFGFTVEGNTMRLSLLRAPTSPDPETDQGEHEMEFGVLVHGQSFGASAVSRQVLAYINKPYLMSGPLKFIPSFILDLPEPHGVVLETIKRGEDDEERSQKTVILRLHEGIGGRSKGCLQLKGVRVSSAFWVNILEDSIGDVRIETNKSMISVFLDIGAFEIKTLKLILSM